MPTLSPKRRSELRGEAHALGPVVLIGDKGLTDEVIAEIDRALKAHELIKVRAGGADRDAREIWLDTICTRLEAHAVQQIGKVFVLYRENPAQEKPAGPAPATAPRSGAERLASGREKQRAKDEKKRRARDIEDMRRKGKIPANVKLADEETKRTSRPRSRAPSPLPESEPRRRRPRSSR